MTTEMENKYIDLTKYKTENSLNLYIPKKDKVNFVLGLLIVVYALLPLWSIWALPFGVFLMFNSIPLKYLIKNGGLKK